MRPRASGTRGCHRRQLGKENSEGARFSARMFTRRPGTGWRDAPSPSDVDRASLARDRRLIRTTGGMNGEVCKRLEMHGPNARKPAMHVRGQTAMAIIISV